MNIWLSTAVFGLAAALTVNQGVVGSSPTSGASESITYAANQDVAFLKKQDVSKKTYSQKPLYVEESLTNESMDAFVLRIARRATFTTQSMGYEICGEIEDHAGTYSIAFYTSAHNTQCTFFRPETGRSGISVHTHPAKEKTTFAYEDYAMPGYLIHPRGGVKFQAGRGTEKDVK